MDPGQSKGVDVNVCAAKIKRGITRNKAEIFVGGGEILLIYIKRYIPALFRFIAKRVSAR
jgi:dehydrogenase/reductase SDR family protein 7B